MSKFDYEIEDFMEYCQSKGLSKKTMRSYEQTLKLFVKYLLEEKGMVSTKEVTKEAIREYIVYLRERGQYTIISNENSREWNKPQNRTDYLKPIQNVTINNYIRNLKVYFSFMEENYMIKGNPFKDIKFLKAQRNKKVFIKDEEFYRLLKSLDITKYAEYRDYIIIQLVFDTGMRIGETLLIDVNTDLDLDNRAIHLRPETTKAKIGRTVFFSVKMGELLKRWIKFKDRYIESNLLFPVQLRDKPLLINNFEKNYKKYCGRVGIKESSPHGIRNNFAKRFLLNGGDIYTLSKILGHSSIKVTEQCYLDFNDDDIKNSYQRYSPLANLKRAYSC